MAITDVEEFLGTTTYSLILEEIESVIGDTLTTDEEAILSAKLNNVVREIVLARQYPTSFEEDAIAEDVLNYWGNIVNLTVYDYNQIGAEYQSTHNENSVNRTWVDRNKLFAGIDKFVR